MPRGKVKLPDSAALLRWYDRHRRDLPWRAASGVRPDPYAVWLSEVMLQQTTVPVVGPYYRAFLARWPRVEDLAAAPIEDVMAAWAGLGYYRRARMLHACAQRVAGELGGVFPKDEAALRALPGIGPYTAAAIRAIAFDLPANVVDGNVERVVARVFAVRAPLRETKTHLRNLAADLLPKRRHGDYAQALMDLGATVCTPRQPRCGVCPWAATCQARLMGIAADLPASAPKPKKPQRWGVVFWLTDRCGRVLVRRRAPEGLLGGMLEIPSTPWQENPPSRAALAVYAPAKVAWQSSTGEVRHGFTHFDLRLTIMKGKLVSAPDRARVEGSWIPVAVLDDHGFPSIMRKVIAMARR